MALAEKYVDTMNVAVPTQKPLVRGDREVTSIPQERQKADLLRLLAVSGFVIAALAVITIVASMIVATQEWSQYDRVNRIANEQGLKMNEENVRNVGR